MNTELSEIQEVLKRIAKARGLKYRDLALMMKMSESGVKKLFRASDLSFSRIKKLCQVLEVNLNDVLEESKSGELLDAEFSLSQEKFFFKNLDYFYFYWKLVVERTPLDKIIKSFSLSSLQVTRYLTKLDQFGIIELHPENRVVLPRRKSKKWVGHGPLTKHVQRDWGLKLWQEASTHDLKRITQSKAIIRQLKLTRSSYQDLLDAFEELESEFLKRSTREQNLSKEELLKVKLMMGSTEGSFVENLQQ
jgi:DNA-binding Xre family transcriptional regulator